MHHKTEKVPMKLLVCATEYHPYGTGIANVVYNVVERLKELGVECTVCSPTGPDIKLGSLKLIEKTRFVKPRVRTRSVGLSFRFSTHTLGARKLVDDMGVFSSTPAGLNIHYR